MGKGERLDKAGQSIPTRHVYIRNNDGPEFDNEVRKNNRRRDRFRKKAFKTKKDCDINKY